MSSTPCPFKNKGAINIVNIKSFFITQNNKCYLLPPPILPPERPLDMLPPKREPLDIPLDVLRVELLLIVEVDEFLIPLL